MTWIKKGILFFYILLHSTVLFSQKKSPAFKPGEYLQYKMSYSGFLRAGTASLALKDTIISGRELIHANGFGKTTGLVGWFFKVRDRYESFFTPNDVKPYLFKRNVNEGGHTILRDTEFDYDKKVAKVKDYKHNKEKQVDIEDIQDMISSFYYLRNQKLDTLKIGDKLEVNMFFDFEIYPFKLYYLGEEILRTNFGKIKTLKFRPIVQSGRVFKEQESITIWVTSDSNHIPIQLKASLAVGSLRAELNSYKGLANSFEIVFD